MHLKFGIFILVIMSSVLLNATTKLSPTQILTLQNNIVSVKLIKDTLLIGTDFGEVLRLDKDENTPIVITKLPNIASYHNDSYAPKVYSLDFLNEKFLILSEGAFGTKDLFLFYDDILHPLKGLNNLSIKKVAFINDNQVFLGLSSNEIILYDLKTQKIIYKKQLSEASFADFALDLELGRYVLSCESGILYYGEIQSGKVIQELEGANKDNVYQVKMARNSDIVKFLAAGQDRHIGIYTLNLKTNVNTFKSLDADFLVYSVGLSNNGKIGAYMVNEQSDIQVFDIESFTPLCILSGHKSLLNNIIFATSTKIISSEDGKNILMWEISNAK